MKIKNMRVYDTTRYIGNNSTKLHLLLLFNNNESRIIVMNDNNINNLLDDIECDKFVINGEGNKSNEKYTFTKSELITLKNIASNYKKSSRIPVFSDKSDDKFKCMISVFNLDEKEAILSIEYKDYLNSRVCINNKIHIPISFYYIPYKDSQSIEDFESILERNDNDIILSNGVSSIIFNDNKYCNTINFILRRMGKYLKYELKLNRIGAFWE